MPKHTSKAATRPKYTTSTMLAPKYVTQFQCLGPECPDTCCAGWSITVDKETFQAYRRVVQPHLKPIIQEYLVQIDKDSHANHARIDLRKADSHCGLHSAEGLCMVQQHLGEDALSNTCYIYPRTIVQFGDRLEQSLTLSCPEAARLALTQADAFEFVTSEFTTRLATTAALNGPIRGFSLEALDEVHIFLIQLFQTPALSITERLATTGWLCQQLDALVTSNEQAKVGTLLGEMRDLVESGRIQPIVGQLNRKHDASVTVFSILFGTKLPADRSAAQTEVLKQVQAGLGITLEIDLVRISENYARGIQLLQTKSDLYDRLMSHYLLNDLVRETFPWTQATAMEHYRRLLTRYGILRLMLAGIAANAGEAPDESSIVRTTQVFCRIYQHNQSFAAHAEKLMTDSDWTRLDQLYALLN
jgi:lysine-N-methylase